MLLDDYEVLIGIEHLSRIETATSISFDCETLQLHPEQGKLRLLQLGSTVRKLSLIHI